MLRLWLDITRASETIISELAPRHFEAVQAIILTEAQIALISAKQLTCAVYIDDSHGRIHASPRGPQSELEVLNRHQISEEDDLRDVLHDVRLGTAVVLSFQATTNIGLELILAESQKSSVFVGKMIANLGDSGSVLGGPRARPRRSNFGSTVVGTIGRTQSRTRTIRHCRRGPARSRACAICFRR